MKSPSTDAARPRKVLMLIDHLDAGGAQSLLVDLVEGLDRARFEPLVCVLRASSLHVPRLRQRGVPVFELGTGRFDPRKFFRLRALMRRERPDIVHTHLSAARVLGGLAVACLGGSKLICHDHSGEESLRKNAAFALWMLYPLERFLMRWTHALIAVSGDTARFARGVKGLPENKIRVVYNGIATRRFETGDAETGVRWRRAYGIAEDAYVIGALGRLSHQKGIRHLVEAAPRILAAAPGARFVVAGQGPLRGSLEAQARRLGVAEAFCFSGHHGEVEPIYRALDLFVLPSEYEPFGLVVLEALACGRPVIAAAVGGVPEIMENGRDGVLVPPGNPARLAEAVLWLMNAPELAAHLAEKGRARVQEHFDLKTTLVSLEAIYAEVLKAR